MKRTFHSMLRPKSACITLLLLVLLFTLVSGSALAGGTGDDSTGREVSPTTGLATDKPYRPVLVNISNSEEARPPWGLGEADIVYEAIIWEPSHTRYLGVFNDSHPNSVGSLRGARVYQAEIRQEWDCPFVIWGGQQSDGTNIYDYFNEHNVSKAFQIDGIHIGPYKAALSRRPERVSPHNAVVDLGLVVDNFWPAGEDGEPYAPNPPSFQFSQTPSSSDETAVSLRIDYGDAIYQPEYTFNQETRSYERWYDGSEQYDGDSGKRIVASNVIVQYCVLEYYEGAASRPVMWTTGNGVIDAFIDGRHIRGTWTRTTADDRTEYFDESGSPLVLLPGKTFIQILPPDFEITYTNQAGETLRVSANFSN